VLQVNPLGVYPPGPRSSSYHRYTTAQKYSTDHLRLTLDKLTGWLASLDLPNPHTSFCFFWFGIHTASIPSTAETHTGGGAVLGKPEGSPGRRHSRPAILFWSRHSHTQIYKQTRKLVKRTPPPWGVFYVLCSLDSRTGRKRTLFCRNHRQKRETAEMMTWM